ncbi:MAG: putative porin [Bacteroidota bacterium]
MRNSALLIFAFILLSFSAFSQADSVRRPVRTKTAAPISPTEKVRRGSSIVNDSSRSPYGPSTTRWTTEREMFTAKTNFRPIDTTINNYHRWTYVQKSANFYQDLGNNGTALNPIFPILPATIGATPGFNAYAPYWNEELKLFDTKSPYTRMYLVWGGQGRAATRVEYSRNINKKWNVSFNYRPILTDKQVLRNGRADRNVISHYYDFYTHYTTKDDRYKVVAAYQRIRHHVIENGGLTFSALSQTDSTYSSFFGNVSPNLTRAHSFEQHNKYHLFQQFNLGKIQAYHILDFERQINWYREALSVDPIGYYDYNRIDSIKTTSVDSTSFKTFSNQIGIKGQIGKKNNLFYNGWLKFRTYDFWNKYLDTDTIYQKAHATEKYIGGEIQYALDSIQHITGLIEVLTGGYSRIESTGHMRWFDFQAIHRISKPTMLQSTYSGRFDGWNNDFKNVESIYLAAFPKVQLGPLFISPGLTYTAFVNYIYFTKGTFPDTKQTVLPVQASAPVQYASPQVSMDVRFFRKMHFRPQVLYTKVLSDRDSALRMPTFFMNGQLAFEGELFKKAMQVQIGVDAHWHSSYTPMGYDPATQTFYNQYTVKPPSYLLADVFLNGKIKRGRFFIKYHNILQRFTKVGYMPTPYYRGVTSILDFGFELMLFD